MSLKIRAGVDVMLSRWCSITHTFLEAWGELTLTLEDVCYLMGLNATGEVNLSLDSTSEQQEIVEALQNSKDPFTTIKSGDWILLRLRCGFPRGGFDISTYVHTGFLEMFFYERFASCSPSPNEFDLGQAEYCATRRNAILCWRRIWGCDNPLRVARQFGLDQGVSVILAFVDGQDAWSRYLKEKWRKDADVSHAVVTFPGKRRTSLDSESVTVEVVDSKKNSDLCTASNVNRETWGYSKFLKDEVLDLVDGFRDTGPKVKNTESTSAVPRGRVSSCETELVNMALHDRMGEIFGDEADGLDVPTGDLNDVEMLSEGPNEVTEVVMDGENEESSEGDDSADDLSSESEESREENDQEGVRVQEKGIDVELDRGLSVGSKEVVCLEEIDSSYSQGGEGDVARAKNSTVISRVVVPFGFAPFGTASSVGVGGGGDVVPFALGGVRGASATPCGSTSEVVTGNAREERDGEYIMVHRDDGLVELKKGSESVMVKLEYFDGVEDLQYVLREFGMYLEFLDHKKLSTARAEDLEFLHKKLTSLKNDGLEVKWLFDRNEHLVAQLEAVRWCDKVEQLRTSLKIATGTVAHLEGASIRVDRLESCDGETVRWLVGYHRLATYYAQMINTNGRYDLSSLYMIEQYEFFIVEESMVV
ncbi:hypothetical protein Vadar_026237 [Vaccinium darrowii]|uniref:Uncharacterized protein n=1 Tax=Vaccinium darrowii TaxID=229202 RepID=A0ACB7XCX9_9ERIC|nr:hypothetical protein Vadar_026237 [Vaccinium darrowii]